MSKEGRKNRVLRTKEQDCRNRERYKRNNLERCTEKGKPDNCMKEQSTVMHN